MQYGPPVALRPEIVHEAGCSSRGYCLVELDGGGAELQVRVGQGRAAALFLDIHVTLGVCDVELDPGDSLFGLPLRDKEWISGVAHRA